MRGRFVRVAVWAVALAAACGGRSERQEGDPGAGGTGGGGGSGATAGRPSCEALAEQYGQALEAARRCDPTVYKAQCPALSSSALGCGCPTYVDNDTQLVALSEEYVVAQCMGPIACAPCQPGLVGSECSTEGRCVDVHRGLPIP
jgi:hypothetical protein